MLLAISGCVVGGEERSMNRLCILLATCAYLGKLKKRGISCKGNSASARKGKLKILEGKAKCLRHRKIPRKPVHESMTNGQRN
jgi:hypothetical protein